MARRSISKDLYKILKVSSDASTVEIKQAYRKIALASHPDRHDGCKDKTRVFKEASEAYNILMDNIQRREYDLSRGQSPAGWYNKNRRRPPPANYRKVYAPHAPADGKWHDAQRHYEMHYGEGMFREAVKVAYNRAKAAGEFDYHSPLGTGFAFESKEERHNRYGQNSFNENPYSKAEQGPLDPEIIYEDTDIKEGKRVVKRRLSVVSKLHERRQSRREKQAAMEPAPLYPGQQNYQPLNAQNSEACAIM